MKQFGILLACCIALAACNNAGSTAANNASGPVYMTMSGPAQGTTFQITFQAPQEVDYSQQVDSILRAIDQSMSTYLDESLISKFNGGQDSLAIGPDFFKVLSSAIETGTATGLSLIHI